MNDNVIQNIVNDKTFNDSISISQSAYLLNVLPTITNTYFPFLIHTDLLQVYCSIFFPFNKKMYINWVSLSLSHDPFFLQKENPNYRSAVSLAIVPLRESIF